MKTEKIGITEACDTASLAKRGLEYAWIMKIGSVTLGRTAAADLSDPDEILEARIFSDREEIHIFRFEDELTAVRTCTEDSDVNVTDRLSDAGGDHYFEEKQVLRRRFGKSVTLRRFIGHDEDGLSRIERTVLCDADLGGKA